MFTEHVALDAYTQMAWLARGCKLSPGLCRLLAGLVTWNTMSTSRTYPFQHHHHLSSRLSSTTTAVAAVVGFPPVRS